jgi:hypothetical protein
LAEDENINKIFILFLFKFSIKISVVLPTEEQKILFNFHQCHELVPFSPQICSIPDKTNVSTTSLGVTYGFSIGYVIVTGLA